MPLINRTKKKTIIKKVKIALRYHERLRGLMFRKKPDYALILQMPFESCINSAIHMLFVFYPIDVLFLNSKKKVVDRVLGLKPFTLCYVPRRAAKYIVELPEGFGRLAKIGDFIGW